MKTKASIALMLDRYWALEERWAKAQLEALQNVPADALFREPTLEAYLEAKLAETDNAFATGEDGPKTKDDRLYTVQQGVAIIPLTGALLERPTSTSGGTSTIFARRQIRQAAGDDRVKDILFLINSPGGAINGLGPLADDIKSVGGKKMTCAYAGAECFSAAYWLASQCRAVVASPHGMVGSIGVFTVLEDDTKKCENDGLVYTLVSSGGIKGKGAIGQPIDDELVKDVQERIDARFGEFVDAVAGGRRMTTARVREMGTGHVWSAKRAKEYGLIDDTGTEDDALRGLVAARAK